jgi:hypothetical protein
MIKKLLIMLAFGILPLPILAQTDTTKTSTDEEQIDFSQFAGDAEVSTEALNDGVKRYCNSKVFGISPTKLISVGYDYQLGYTMTSNAAATFAEDAKINNTSGLRILANFPVISRNKLTLNLGFSYLESAYSFEEPSKIQSPLKKSLNQASLKSTGVNFTLFKPLNEKTFLLINTSHDLNGDYKLDEFQPFKYIKHSALAVFGWKKHDRLQYGFGASRTYRVGEVNYIPVVLYNYTSENRKWGMEAVFPARVHYRRSFSPRSLLLLGYELEGNSYHLQNRNNIFNTNQNKYENLELRRSELRLRVIYERSLYQFVWLSVQAGYRYNYRFNVDDGEFFRGFFGDQKYVMENKLTNPLYFNISLNLVSP